MKNLCVITARGGSKRIPKKNIKDFCGKPIIAYSIQAAIESGLFDEIMVSTDSVEIAEVAKKFGAQVPFFRSEATSNDLATTGDALTEVLNEYSKLGKVFNTLCCIYPTAPFVTGKKLIAAYETLCSTDADEVNPVVRYSFPPQRASRINEQGYLVYLHPENFRTRSQDLEPIYHDAGQFYFYKLPAELRFGAMRAMPIKVDELEVQDIDNESDWKIAEMKYRMMMEQQN